MNTQRLATRVLACCMALVLAISLSTGLLSSLAKAYAEPDVGPPERVAVPEPIAQVPGYEEPSAQRSDYYVDITGQNAAQISTAFSDALDQSVNGNVVTAIGHNIDHQGIVVMDIPAGVRVVWQAQSVGLSFKINYTAGASGAFEIATGGRIEASRNGLGLGLSETHKAIDVYNGTVIVSGGELVVTRPSPGDSGFNCGISVYNGNVIMTGGKVQTTLTTAPIYLDWGNVRISGGEVIGQGSGTADYSNVYGIRLENNGTVAITGGLVSATGGYTSNTAISIGWGLGLYFPGTCIGDFDLYYTNYGSIVEVSSLTIPPGYNGTHNGMTQVSGDGIDYVAWDTTGSLPFASFEYVDYASDRYHYEVTWGPITFAPKAPVEFPVRVFETGALYKTLSEAIAGAESGGLTTYTLEVIGDVLETDHVTITSNVTIVNKDGGHVIEFTTGPALRFSVEDGGDLTLGDGLFIDPITIQHNIVVTNGHITLKNGVILLGSGYALVLEGPLASGTLAGGSLQGGESALFAGGGAYIDEISGGVFIGETDAVLISDEGTKVDLISGGIFYQSRLDNPLHGHGIFLQNDAEIGEISGGFFEALDNSALVVIRGATIGEISGGDFVAYRTNVPFDEDLQGDGRNATVWVENRQNEGHKGSSIGTISGGSFSGATFGILLITDMGTTDADYYGCSIGSITGGLFMGSIGLQVDRNCHIDEIMGGEFYGVQGLFNVGWIGEIGGQAYLHGISSYGLINYRTLAHMGRIGVISGGMITSDRSDAIANSGVIELISDGIIVGWYSAINSAGLNPGRLDKITGGVFWGQSSQCIRLAYQLELEPGIDTMKGFGRYMGLNGIIFNDENLVKYPQHMATGIMYEMSTETEAVASVENTEFKYLRIPLPEGYYMVTVHNSDAAVTGEGIYQAGETVTINAGGNPSGYVFAFWNMEDSPDVSFTINNPTTTFTMPDHDVVVWAIRTPIFGAGFYYVTVENSYASVTGAGGYREGDLVTIDAGLRYGYSFVMWTTEDDVAFENATDGITTFTMPARNVKVTAVWTRMPVLYIVTVIDSYAEDNGSGGYWAESIVTLDAGSRDDYTFAGWITEDDIILDDASSAITTFTMPAQNVTVTATWLYNEPEIPQTGDNNILLWTAAVLLIALGGCSMLIWRRRRHI